MADAVATHVISDGSAHAVLKFTNVSDATGEAAVDKITASSLGAHGPRNAACIGIVIEKIWFTTGGMGVTLYWDATADVVALSLGPDAYGELDFREFGGLANNSGAGTTGKLQLTTVGPNAGDTYMIVVKVKKLY